jgi:hypothetical protein
LKCAFQSRTSNEELSTKNAFLLNEKARCPLSDTGLLQARKGLGPMSRAQEIWGLTTKQTATLRIQRAGHLNLGTRRFLTEQIGAGIG